MQIDILRLAELIGACSLIIGSVIAVYKLYDKLLDRVDKLEDKISELESELNRVKKEDTLVIFALRACLDGLHQKGCNGKVTDAIKMIDKHINKAAHDQE